MHDIFTYIWLKFVVNVGKYTIHGTYGFGYGRLSLCFLGLLAVAKKNKEKLPVDGSFRGKSGHEIHHV